MNTNPETVCRNCRYWTSSVDYNGVPDGVKVPRTVNSGPEDTVILGICRRYAPHPDWANSREGDWCGDFTPSNKPLTYG